VVLVAEHFLNTSECAGTWLFAAESPEMLQVDAAELLVLSHQQEELLVLKLLPVVVTETVVSADE
jgi:hypothetical protein